MVNEFAILVQVSKPKRRNGFEDKEGGVASDGASDLTCELNFLTSLSCSR